MIPLSRSQPIAKFLCKDFFVIYVLDPENHMVGFRMVPARKAAEMIPHRTFLETPEILALPGSEPFRAYRGESSLVQLKLAEDDSGGAFGEGRTLRFNATVAGLRFAGQTIECGDGKLTIRTNLKGARDFFCEHVLEHREGDDAVSVHTLFRNGGDVPLTLELLSSFELGYLSPFDDQDSAERLHIHRFRSLWSAEGRHERLALEEMHLERSWSSHSIVSERFGQVGSMPVRGFFPFVAVEDALESVYWGAQLACPASWQMEVYRRDDKISLSGGLADWEFGHWKKRVAPGESFQSPTAFLSTSVGSFDNFCQRLTRMHSPAGGPAIENELPVIFNEWCSSWGWPTPEFILQTANRLAGTPVKIFVIDDGWAEKSGNDRPCNGDWIVDATRFPEGLQAVTRPLREKGLLAGLWFEFEVCTEGSRAFALDEHKLRRYGRTLKIGSRHFWDFTDPWTFEYLTDRVIRRLGDDGFSYLKIDYNEAIGIGCDHDDSPGEGLRTHIAGVQSFLRKIRESLPDLIIEICSSGGHRLEPSMLRLAAMGSFSDAHESADIPIIAANLHRLILPRQSQIWAVLHASDSIQRLQYSLAACFLGRACLSGEITTLSDEQFAVVQDFLGFYERVKHLIRDGESTIHRKMNRSYRHPRGWQAVVRVSRQPLEECLVVIHAFEQENSKKFAIPLPDGDWEIVETMGAQINPRWKGTELHGEVFAPFSGHVLHLRKTSLSCRMPVAGPSR